MKTRYFLLLLCSLVMMQGCSWSKKCCDHNHEPAQASTNKADHVIKITTEQAFDEIVLHATKPVVADFSASWCGACQDLKPVMHKTAADLHDQYVFAEIDVDQAATIAKKYNVVGIPTVIFFENGKEKGAESRIVGAVNEESLKGSIKKAFATK